MIVSACSAKNVVSEETERIRGERQNDQAAIKGLGVCHRIRKGSRLPQRLSK